MLIEYLLEYDTGGDPITGVKWSRRTTAKVALALGDFGITVSANTVARLLPRMGYASASTTSNSPPTPVPIATTAAANDCTRALAARDGARWLRCRRDVHFLYVLQPVERFRLKGELPLEMSAILTFVRPDVVAALQ
jgi:hypothetical protein